MSKEFQNLLTNEWEGIPQAMTKQTAQLIKLKVQEITKGKTK